MKSFITSVEKLFKLDTGIHGEDNFDVDKRQLIIPKYQREYQWSSEMISTLLNDINDRRKFLGIVILDQMNDSYEVVDGQQRLTTCFLLMAAIYNFYENDQFERRALEPLIERRQRLILENHSVGAYLVKNGNKYELSIDLERDIYFQKEVFENAWEQVNNYVKETLGEHETVRSFKSKLFSCDFLVLINAAPGDEQSVEQVFLDINEKLKALEPADIFKGHCFELFNREFHVELKEKWSKIKAVSKKFEKHFKYDDISWFLYMYLLMEGKINKNLSIPNSGHHYLHGKRMGEVDTLLNNIIAYGEAVTDFYTECKNVDYCFESICRASYEYRNTSEVPLMKKMSMLILEKTSSSAQFQKIPFMYFISMRDRYVNNITHEQVRRIVTNLFSYAILFEVSTERKSKNDIERSVMEFFGGEEQLQELVRKTKDMRNRQIEKFVMIQEGNKFEKLAALYSLMDFYDVNRGIINNYYSKENGYNLEHLVINDNNTIEWIVGEQKIIIRLDDMQAKKRKKRTINYVLINETLNGELKSFDIITKIQKIIEWHEARSIAIPMHVKVILDAIQGMEGYNELVTLKESRVLDENVIKEKYTTFLDTYFDTSTDVRTREALTTAFRESFQ